MFLIETSVVDKNLDSDNFSFEVFQNIVLVLQWVDDELHVSSTALSFTEPARVSENSTPTSLENKEKEFLSHSI